MRRIMTLTACVALLMWLSVQGASALTFLDDDVTDLYAPGFDDVMAEVWEKEYLIVAADAAHPILGSYIGQYLYSYTVANDNQSSTWCWGMQDPRKTGATINYVNSPTGWTDNFFACPWASSSLVPDPVGWVTVQGGAYDIPIGESLDTFWFISPNAPKGWYQGFAHGDADQLAYGLVSGPSPEPSSMVLLACVGVAATMLVRKRRKA